MLTGSPWTTQKQDHRAHTEDFPTNVGNRAGGSRHQQQQKNEMNKAEFEQARIARERITNPEPPKPTPHAVRVKNGGKLYAGKPRQEGEIILVWPDEMPPGFISKQQARDLIELGYCTLATDEEISAFLEQNEPA